MKQLKKLLLKVQAGEPINFASLVKHMPENTNALHVFTPTMVAANKYIVKVNDTQAFEHLLAQTSLPVSRAQAAINNYLSSHDRNCDSAYLLCFPAGNPAANALITSSVQQRQLEVAALSQKALLSRNYIPQKNALLIENQDCFFQWQNFTQHFAALDDLTHTDIFFAGGTRILNAELTPILAEYEHFFCAFDYDLKGLQMAQSLCAKSLANTHILIPNDISSKQHLFTFKPNSTAHFQQALNLCDQLDLVELKQVLYSTRHYMEQEALLTI